MQANLKLYRLNNLRYEHCFFFVKLVESLKKHIILKSNWEMGAQNKINQAYNLALMDLFLD